MTRYCIHACDDDPRHEHLVVAPSFVEAAALFAERWLSPRAGETQVELELQDLDTGARQRLSLDLAGLAA